jgi:FOG: Ankyrin repeat
VNGKSSQQFQGIIIEIPHNMIGVPKTCVLCVAAIKLLLMSVQTLFERVCELLSQNKDTDAETLIHSQPEGFAAADYSGNLIHYAVFAGRGDVVQWLLDHGADLHAPDGRGLTPLMLAYQQGFEEIGKTILLRDPSQANERCVGWAPWTKGCTPIMFVRGDGSVDMAECLLNHGADVNARATDGRTALMCAAEIGDTRLMELLLARGAVLDLYDEEGKDALGYAVEGENTEGAEFLLKKGIKISDAARKNEFPVLCKAILGEDVEMVELLLSHGAHVAHRDEAFEENALELAERVDAPASIVQLLRQALARELA